MKFFVSNTRVIPKGTSVNFNEHDHVEIHDPEATIVVHGELTNSENTSMHIYAKNFVIAPGGKVNLQNAQIIITDNVITHGSLAINKSVFKTTYNLIAGIKENLAWTRLRKQIFWMQENDPDCNNGVNVKAAVAYAEQKLATLIGQPKVQTSSSTSQSIAVAPMSQPAASSAIASSSSSTSSTPPACNDPNIEKHIQFALTKRATDYENVISIYEQTVAAGYKPGSDAKFDKHIGSAYIYKGKALFDTQQYQEALTAFENAKKLLPKESNGKDNNIAVTWIARVNEKNPNLKTATPANSNAAEPPRATML